MRWLPTGLLVAAVLAALALLQGMLTAGLVPLAVFGPVYALARTAGDGAGPSRRRAARVTVAATAGLGAAFLPALGLAESVTAPPWLTLGVVLVTVGTGALAGFAATPTEREPTGRERQRWSFVNAMADRHARGLTSLAGVAVLGGTLIALLREAPIARLGGQARTLPEAVFGAHAVGGALALPGPEAAVAVAIPLSLAPLALGFLTSPKRSAPLALGGLAVPLLAPLVLYLDVPVQAATGAWVPITVLERPGLAVADALAPSAAGLLVGAGVVYAVRRGRFDPRASRAAWALAAALLAAPLWGLLPGALVLSSVLAAAGIVAVASGRAPFGLAVALGGLAGSLAGVVFDVPTGWAVGVLLAAAAGSAAGTYAASRSIQLPGGGLRSPWTLVYVLAAVGGVGVLFALAPDLAGGSLAFPAPHARGLGAALAAGLGSRGLPLLAWGLVAGAVVEAIAGRGAWIALGALAGPGVAGLVLAGSLLRALWENGLLERAREGYVMRGQLGYELVRVHVLVTGVLAGEALAVGIAAIMS